MTTTNDEPITLFDLAHFTGSETFTRHPLCPHLVFTEGVKYMADKAGAYWLIDIVASYQGETKVRAEDFQLWTIERNDSGGATVYMTDGNTDSRIVEQEIPYTDFPESLGPAFKVFAELGSVDGVNPHRVLMLPSER